jgi:protein O-GlcNAc transferase
MIAKQLATDPQTLAQHKQRLQQNRLTTPLFDTQGFARDLERLYWEIWRQHQAGIRKPVVLPH